VGNIEEERLPQPLPPFLKPLGVAGRAEASGPTGETKKKFSLAGGTTNPGKTTLGIAAVKKAVDDFLDDRPEIAICLLETLLVLLQEAFEMIEQYPVENGPLWMTDAIDS
jgi:hypothetical protein